MNHKATRWKLWFNWLTMPSTWKAWWQWQRAVPWFVGLAASPAPGTQAWMSSLNLGCRTNPCVSNRTGRFCCVQPSAACPVDPMHPTAEWLLRHNWCMLVLWSFSHIMWCLLPEDLCVWGGSGRFPLKGSVHHPKAEAWQTSRCWGSEVTNQILLEPQGSSFWQKNSEQSDLNHKKTVIPSGFKPKKMFTPALLHKTRFLVLFYWQCTWLPG